MKHNRALLLLLVAIVAVLPAAAQFRYAPVVGVTISDLKFKQDIFPVSKAAGAQVGVIGEMMFSGIGFGLDLGLLYNQMGAKTNLGDRQIWANDDFGNERVMLHTIQIPIHLRFKWTRMEGLEDYVAPFVYGGPDFAINFAHSKIKGNSGVKNPFEYSGGDIGLTCGGGFEILKRWQLSAQYTWGLTYLLRTRKLENLSARNRQLTIRLSYFF